MPNWRVNDQPLGDVWGLNLKAGNGIGLAGAADAQEQKVDVTVNGTGFVADYLVYQSGSTVNASALTAGLPSYSGAATDAVPVIQQAVNALATGSGGAIVFRGNLTFATQLVLYPNVAFMGAAPFGYWNGSTPYGPTIKSTFNGSAILITGDARGSTFPYLANFELAGSTGLTSQNGIELNVSGGTLRDVFIDNVFIDGVGQHGIVFGGSSVKLHAYRLYVEACVGNGLDGSSSAGSNQLALVDPYFANNTGFGLVFPTSMVATTITGGRFSTNAGGALSYLGSTNAAIVDGVYFDGNGGGATPQISIPFANFSSARNVIANCIFNGAVTNHIVMSASNTTFINIANCGFTGSSGDAIAWTTRAGNRILIENCMGYTDVRGKITNPFSAASRIGAAGTAAAPTASTDYQAEGTKLMMSATGGTSVSITIKDSAGSTIASGLTSYTGVLPHQFSINFGAFSVAPTVLAAVA